MAKNRNGMGSIRERADGRFEGRYTGPDGRQHSVFGKTSKECTTKLKAALAAVDSGSWTQPNKLTVAQWIDLWLDKYCTNIRDTTRVSYTNQAGNIKRVIGHVKLTGLKTLHIRQLHAELAKTLAPTSRKVVQVRLVQILDDAVRDKLIPENPARGMSLEKARPVREMHIIDKSQFAAFISTAKEEICANELVFLLFTGLRIGELLGLQLHNVDLDAGEIVIDRQIVSSGAMTETKNGESRTIKLTDEAIEILRNQRVTQAQQRLKAGAEWIDEGFVFTGRCGKHRHGIVLRKSLHSVGAKIVIPALHPHDLRHSYAVAALRAGIPIKAVQHNLGHASAAMTLDVYAKYTDDTGSQAADTMSAYIKSVLGSN